MKAHGEEQVKRWLCMARRSATIPGALWRFLALEEKDRWITITDSDRVPLVLHDVERTEHILGSGLRFWRAPYVFDAARNNDHPGFYRTATVGHSGVVGGQPVVMLMKAFLWHTIRGTMPNQCTIRSGGKAITKLTIEFRVFEGTQEGVFPDQRVQPR